MKNIEVTVLNPGAVDDAERMMVAMARLTQRGHKIKTTTDFFELMAKEYSDNLVDTLASLPHPTIQKFAVINILIVGASRRFLAQITRHQNEVKFMSGSLQYSDYSSAAQFVVPYEITRYDAENGNTFFTDQYIAACEHAMGDYRAMVDFGLNNDTAGYVAPQGLRNVLLISATPYQWKHMIGQRICRRNTLETRYVMLRCWEELYPLSAIFNVCGPSCLKGGCEEGNMSCGAPFESNTPAEILDMDFGVIRGM